MNICVHGIDFRNYGALMMLSAIVRVASAQHPSIRIFVPFTSGSKASRFRLGVGAALLTPRYRVGLLPVGGLATTKLFNFAPKLLLQRAGVALASDMHLHLDASGYAYGDPWGAARAKRMAMLARYWKSKSQPLIVLPQAFGPFKQSAVASATVSYLDYASYIYARDDESIAHLRALNVPTQLIAKAPDFTADIGGALPLWNAHSDRVAIVPNKRVIDRAGLGSGYFDLMVQCALVLNQLGLKPEIVIHEEDDLDLANSIARTVGCAVRAPAGHTSSREVFSAYRFIIGCRYHAIAAALGAGVPALAVGWSHKYHGLMRDYQVSQLSCDASDPLTIRQRIIHLANSAQQVRDILLQSRLEVLEANEVMWKRIWDFVVGGHSVQKG